MKWTLDKQKTKKKRRWIDFYLFILLLFFSPTCHFYFPGSPLCFSSCCLHLSPSFLSHIPSHGMPRLIIITPLPSPKNPEGYLQQTLWSHPPVYRLPSCFKPVINRTNRDFLNTYKPSSPSVFTCVFTCVFTRRRERTNIFLCRVMSSLFIDTGASSNGLRCWNIFQFSY